MARVHPAHFRKGHPHGKDLRWSEVRHASRQSRATGLALVSHSLRHAAARLWLRAQGGGRWWNHCRPGCRWRSRTRRGNVNTDWFLDGGLSPIGTRPIKRVEYPCKAFQWRAKFSSRLALRDGVLAFPAKPIPEPNTALPNQGSRQAAEKVAQISESCEPIFGFNRSFPSRPYSVLFTVSWDEIGWLLVTSQKLVT